MKGLEGKVTFHHWLDAKDKDAFVKEVGNKIKAIAIAYTANKVDEKFHAASFPISNRCRALVSATIISTPSGPARTASSSPIRRRC